MKLGPQQWEHTKEAVRVLVDSEAESETGSGAGIIFRGHSYLCPPGNFCFLKIPSLPKRASVAGNNTWASGGRFRVTHLGWR